MRLSTVGSFSTAPFPIATYASPHRCTTNTPFNQLTRNRPAPSPAFDPIRHCAPSSSLTRPLPLLIINTRLSQFPLHLSAPCHLPSVHHPTLNIPNQTSPTYRQQPTPTRRRPPGHARLCSRTASPSRRALRQCTACTTATPRRHRPPGKCGRASATASASCRLESSRWRNATQHNAMQRNPTTHCRTKP